MKNINNFLLFGLLLGSSSITAQRPILPKTPIRKGSPIPLSIMRKNRYRALVKSVRMAIRLNTYLLIRQKKEIERKAEIARKANEKRQKLGVRKSKHFR